MKKSKYTFLFDTDQKEFYAYNTLSNALVEIDNETYTRLLSCKEESELSESFFDQDLLKALIDQNVLTEKDEDDYLKYKSYITRLRSQRGSMHLTLAPTMDCCFNCHYCFEKYKTANYMPQEVMDAISKYVNNFPDLKWLKLTWFGGEPLMAVKQMERFYDTFFPIWNKEFTSNIITTGYHINKETIRVLKKIGISQIQITLDGTKETHNKVKFLPTGEDVFEKVLGNIELIDSLAPEINVVVRVNLTHQNELEYPKLVELFYKRFGAQTKIGIAPAFVMDRGISNGNDKNGNDSLFNNKQASEYIINLGQQGFDFCLSRYPQPFFYECAIRNEMAIAFDPEGYAYKCWEVIGNKEYAIGKLDDEGQLVEINEKILNRQLYGADPLDDPTCSQCKYLPICNGGCPIQRIENKFEGGHNCNCTYYKGYMADFLKIHLARKKAGLENY